MSTPGNRLSFCELLLHSGLSNRDAGSLGFFMESAFDRVPLADASVLDIGAGEGFHSLYALYAGARRVVAVEPESAGARKGMIQRLMERTNEIPRAAERFVLYPLLVQDLDRPIGGFDVVFCFNMINHVDEAAVQLLTESPEARRKFTAVFADLRSRTVEGGLLILGDKSSANLWRWTSGVPRLRHPFSPAIEWHKHQPPEVWAKLAADAGFEPESLRWAVPFRLRRLRVALANRLAAYCLTSHFILYLRAV